ncbi:multisubunit potassium/proton antiporter PhaC subunit [Rhizobium sp. PP-F2F-G38]|uniref:Na+/H+ antiporter subunit C n=2 Tax=Rhizobiaceae TaxID=82115 RepID=A0AA44CC56_9HYPH|nr:MULTISPECIES: Na+/H+ antiporter subunit C [Rhizobiaceae]PYE24468.1 multisubunit potassium/proton antiporter PhaC subunit [Rhizobium sp. PP-CC-3A-592]PYE33407.1 multisubunit potassium/proton antiporter PhaC subunit [Rhizobium sp. PP-WC-1G-195]PYE41795.1 multisubunit potassium/proton antiporter PhaC subunit [Rhizobium sp. PP-F2F-G20b]PYE98335.1 multisubunit potassium/proton antiporter PhaC subunit [Rhizobium sp. PP-F2F-G38]TCP83560.1 multisubunit potassium/proton antiporter PhaC subunit [Rhiz
MELVLSAGIGVFAGSGIWLLFRPRTYQVVVGLALLSYAVNLFIFGMGRLRLNAPPVLEKGVAGGFLTHTDPLPQALVLTAIVIGFAMTALFLVVLLASRGFTGNDHVDGREER